MNFINKNYLFYLAFLLTIIVGFYFRVIILDYSYVNEWSARDFDRALNIFNGNYIPLAGPEYDNGGRLPGPFLYFLLLIPILFEQTYDSIIVFNFVFNLGGMIFLFWTLQRFFDKFVAILSTIFLLIYLPFVQVFGFPINPAFIFPFIAIFIFLLLELIVNKNYKCLPIIIVVISLAIQLHFSVSTLYVVLLINLLFFKIKIPLRYFLISLGIALLCFAPYIAYKNLFYVTTETWGNYGVKSIKGLSNISLLEVLKIILLNKTMMRLSYFNGLSYWVPFSNIAADLYYFLYYTTFFVYIIQIKKRRIASSKKEIIIFSCFLIPALIYEIIHPKYDHNWYSYIFILPLFIIISSATINLIKNSKNNIRILLITTTVILLCVLIFDGFIHVAKYREQVFINSNKNTQKLIKIIMRELNLSPKELLEKVYFDSPIQMYSLGRSKITNNKSFVKTSKDNINLCYYLVDSKTKNRNFKGLAQKRFDSFLNNADLHSVKLRTKKISFFEIDFLSTLDVYEYIPKSNNSCYKNMSNPFQVTKKQRDLLIHAKSFQKNDPISANRVKHFQKYTPSENLIYLSSSYIVVNDVKKIPIKVKFLIKKTDKNYLASVEINGYAYNGINPTKRLGISIQSTTKTNKAKKINLNMNFYNLFENKLYSTNFSWRQDFNLPEDLIFKKNKFNLFLFWDVEHHEKEINKYQIDSLQTYKVWLTKKNN
jgi:hypothetical protein